MNGIN